MSDSGRRQYAQFCPLARALDAVGERWTLLLVRNLLVGPQRYGELLEGLPGITTNLLAKRLKEMTAQSIIEQYVAHGVTLYTLTERGRALESALNALSAWGEAEPFPKEGHRHLRWAMLGVKRRYRGGLSGSLRVICTDPELDFFLELSEKEIHFLELRSREADVTIQAEEGPLFQLIYGKKSAKALLKSGNLLIMGDHDFLEQALKSTGV